MIVDRYKTPVDERTLILLKKQLRKEDNTPERTLDILDQIGKISIPWELLQNTHIYRELRRLKKSENAKIAAAASAIYSNWKKRLWQENPKKSKKKKKRKFQNQQQKIPFEIKNLYEFNKKDISQIKYYYMHYLAIIDNIHDFFHERGKKCPIDLKTIIKKEKTNLENILSNININNDIFLKKNVGLEIMGEFESNYTLQTLKIFGLQEGCDWIVGNTNEDQLYQSFLINFNLRGKTFYTTHDSAFRKKKFYFNREIEEKFNCNHYILKTPQNNFDSARSSSSSSIIKKKTIIAYPYTENNNKNEWIFKSNILTKTLGGKMSFVYKNESISKILGSLKLWKLFNGKKANFIYKNKSGTILDIDFKPIGSYGGTESGPGPKLLCESISSYNTKNKANTAAKKIYNNIIEIYKNINPNDLNSKNEIYSLILDLKRSGDWEQVIAAIWFKNNSGYKDSENTIVITGDYLCFLFAALNDVDCVFLGAAVTLFYSNKIRKYLSEQGKCQSQKSLSSFLPDSESLNPSKLVRNTSYGGGKDEEDIDMFYTLLENIRENTMNWHSESVSPNNNLSEDYYKNIVELITYFGIENDRYIISNNNINDIIKLFKLFFSIPINDLQDEYKNSVGYKFTQSQPFRSDNSPELENFGFSPIGQETEQFKNKLVYKKIFLMSICILFEYLSLYFNDNFDGPTEEQKFKNSNIKPGLPHIIEGFYYFIITNKIYKKNDSFNLTTNNSIDVIVGFLAIIYSLLIKILLLNAELNENTLNETFLLKGFLENSSKEIFIDKYYEGLGEITTEKSEYILSGQKFLNTVYPLLQGGVKKNKTKKERKKLKITKRRKTSLPKSKKKTKKNKKKKRNKTKIKKGGKNKKKKKKQFFEMSIKELKKYVNKKSKK